MKIAEIKEMSTNDLVERVEAEVVNYNQMVINHSISPLENPAQIKQLRRTIARMRTELRQRELTIYRVFFLELSSNGNGFFHLIAQHNPCSFFS